MLDTLITGATLVDGTGDAPATGPIGVRDGRITAMGDVDEPAAETIDADGLVVSRASSIPHTHYDAQLFWDPAAVAVERARRHDGHRRQLRLHARAATPSDADYLRRMMAKVEGMPLAALETGSRLELARPSATTSTRSTAGSRSTPASSSATPPSGASRRRGGQRPLVRHRGAGPAPRGAGHRPRPGGPRPVGRRVRLPQRPRRPARARPWRVHRGAALALRDGGPGSRGRRSRASSPAPAAASTGPRPTSSCPCRWPPTAP